MGLEAHILTKDSYAPEGETWLVFEMNNTGDEGLYVLTWLTPLEGITSDCLEVTRDNVKVRYDGPLVKRGMPSIDNYVFIGAGETITREFELNSAYKVSLQGEYGVQLRAHIPDAFPDASVENAAAHIADEKISPVPEILTSTVAKFSVKGDGEPELTAGEKARKLHKKTIFDESESEDARAGAKTPLFVGGTAAQQIDTETAHRAGYDLCVAAVDGLVNNSHYVEWFGTHTTSRFQQVKTVYRKVKSGMETDRLTYNLTGDGCQSGWYAYTYHGSSTVWMCGSFWAAPPTGTDSKAGTVLHEQSHALADTDDIVYGQSSCRNLAINDADDAVKNADSFEYYAGG